MIEQKKATRRKPTNTCMMLPKPISEEYEKTPTGLLFSADLMAPSKEELVLTSAKHLAKVKVKVREANRLIRVGEKVARTVTVPSPRKPTLH